MELDDFNIVYNGDGTFTLVPKTQPVNLATLREEYRRLRAVAQALLDQRAEINAKVQEFSTRRDELLAILQANGDPG